MRIPEYDRLSRWLNRYYEDALPLNETALADVQHRHYVYMRSWRLAYPIAIDFVMEMNR